MDLGGFGRSPFYYFSMVQYFFNQHTLFNSTDLCKKRAKVSWFGRQCEDPMELGGFGQSAFYYSYFFKRKKIVILKS